jgi:hypothetical protein
MKFWVFPFPYAATLQHSYMVGRRQDFDVIWQWFPDKPSGRFACLLFSRARYGDRPRYLERWAVTRWKPALRQMGVDEIHMGKKQKGPNGGVQSGNR